MGLFRSLFIILFVHFINHYQVLSQTQEQIEAFIIEDDDGDQICGSHFEDVEWFIDVGTCGGDCSERQICKTSMDTDQHKCTDLPQECVDALHGAYYDDTYSSSAPETTTRAALETTVSAEPEESNTTEAATTTAATTVDTSLSKDATLPPGVKKEDGHDWHPMCCIWASRGACSFNPTFMRPNCQKSCGTYGCREENAEQCQVSIDVKPSKCPYDINGNPNFEFWPEQNQRDKTIHYIPPLWTPLTERLAMGHQQQQVQCSDRYSRCTYWAMNGECAKNKYWMNTRCQRSCNCCGCTVASVAGVRYTPNCRDYQEKCPFWASKGECTRNSLYMNRRCQASCGRC